MKVTFLDNNKKYSPDLHLTQLNCVSTKKNIVAWRNDKIFFQVGVFLSQFEKITIEMKESSDFSIETHLIEKTKAYVGPYLGYGDKKRPLPLETLKNYRQVLDIVKPYKIQTLEPGFHLFSITLHTGSNIDQQEITKKILFKSKYKTIELSLNIKVLSFLLPKPKKFHKIFNMEFWQYPYRVAEYYKIIPFSEKHFSLLRQELKFYKDLGGITTTASICEEPWGGQTYSESKIHYPSMIKWIKQKESFIFDYHDFDAWIEFNQSIGLAKKIRLFTIAPWHNYIYFYENDKLIQEYQPLGSDKFKAIWIEFLKDLFSHLKEKNWLDICYLGIDERGISEEVFSILQELKDKFDIKFNLFGCVDNLKKYQHFLYKFKDLAISDVSIFSEKLRHQLPIKKVEQEISLYSCTEHFPGNYIYSIPIESFWSILIAGKNSNGFLRWAYDAWVKEPTIDGTHNAFEAGDCFFVYPQNNGNFYSSLRLMKMEEALIIIIKMRIILNIVPKYQKNVENIFSVLNEPTIITDHPYEENEKLKKIEAEVNEFQKLFLELQLSLFQKG